GHRLHHQRFQWDLAVVPAGETGADGEEARGIHLVERGDMGDVRPRLGHVGGDGPPQLAERPAFRDRTLSGRDGPLGGGGYSRAWGWRGDPHLAVAIDRGEHIL